MQHEKGVGERDESGVGSNHPRAKSPGSAWCAPYKGATRAERALSGRELSLRMRTQPSQESAQHDAALARALALVRDLRARCPWDRAQTRATLRPYLVEEALELDRALADGAPAALRDELGDLLL